MGITQVSGFSEIADKYEAFFLDMCGVIMVGDVTSPAINIEGELMKPAKLLDGAPECLRKLREANKKISMVTNADESADYLIKLLKKGCGLHDMEEIFDAIVTAGDMVAASLRSWGLKKGAKAFVWGEYPMRGIMRFFSRVESYQEADIVVCCEAIEVNSFKHFELYDSHKKILEFMLENGLPMLAPNDDIVAPTAQGDSLVVAGFFAKAYRDMGGRALSTGKPGESIFNHAYSLLGYPDKQNLVMVGDTLETDIVGAHNFGIDSALITSGNYSNHSDLVTHAMPLEVQPNWMVERFVW